MTTSLDIDLILIITFLALNLGLGLWYGKGIKSVEEFALGGRNFSTSALTVTLIATWFSGSNFNIRISDIYNLGILAIPPIVAGTIYSLMLTYVFVPRMQGFLGKISLADVMGSIYGKHVRIITAICGIIKSTTFVAAQIKIFSLIFNHFFGVNSNYATIISSMIVTIYCAFGGIRSVVLTDIFQFLAFGAFIPTLTILIWNSFGNWESIVDTVTNNPMFDPHLLLDYHNPAVLKYFGVFFYCIMPSLHPATFHRILIARDMKQLMVAFTILTVLYLVFSLFSTMIGLTLLSSNAEIPGNALLPYIIDNYAYTGLKGLVIIGVVAMVMSTADSHINSASVIFIHDLCGPLRLFTNNKKLELQFVRAFTMVIGIIPLYMCISQNNLLDIILLGAKFYDSIVGIPLAVTILGFRTTSRVILSGMAAGALTTYIWSKYFNELFPIGDVIPATFVNLTVMMLMHYWFKDPGRWIGPQIPRNLTNLWSKLRNDNTRNFCYDTLRHFNWKKILIHCSDDTFRGKHHYVAYVFFSVTSLLIAVLSGDSSYIGEQYHNAISTIIMCFSLGISTLLLYMKTTPKRFYNKYMGFLWHIAMFCTLIFGNTILSLIGGFNNMLATSFVINLVAVGVLLRWRVAMVLILIGVILATFIVEYSGLIIDTIVLDNLKWSIVQSLALVFAIIILIRLKQDQFVVNTRLMLKLKDKVLGMELTLENKDKKVERLLNSKQYIFSNLSYDIKSSISIVRTTINLLHKFLPQYYKSNTLFKEKKKVLSVLSLAHSAVERLVLDSNNLIDLSEFEQRKIVFNIELNNLKLLIKEAIDECNKVKNSDKHTISFFYHPQAETIIELDYMRTRQVILDLISNAIQYSESGVVAVKVMPYRQGVQITVEDEGIGIAEDKLKKIFEPFEASGITQSQAGCRGLALSVARKVILHHHGEIRASNRMDVKGSKFTIQLPVRQPQSNFNKGIHSKNKVFGNPKTYEQRIDKIIKSAPAFSHRINTVRSLFSVEEHIRSYKSIMIIDDDQNFLDAISLDICAERYQPIPINNPFEAIRLIKENPSFYSMIILDIAMPGKSGDQVLLEVNEVIKLYSIPVVVVSGHAQSFEIRAQLHSLGVCAFINKPHSTNDIHNLINRYLRQTATFPFNFVQSSKYRTI